MVYDCFAYNGEKEALDIRLHHHSFVDWFVIMESDYTYSGNRKPLYFKELFHSKEGEWLQDFEDKILYVHHSERRKPNQSIWEYEFEQRDMLMSVAPIFKNDDLILYLDCDEIIRDFVAIEMAMVHDCIVTFNMDMRWYYLDCEVDPSRSTHTLDYSAEQCFKWKWHMGKACRKKHLYEKRGNLYSLRTDNIWNEELRTSIDHAGWHFSNLRGAKEIIRKIESFSHSEELKEKYIIAEYEIKDRIKNLRDPLGRDIWFKQTKILDVPDYVSHNTEKFKEVLLCEQKSGV